MAKESSAAWRDVFTEVACGERAAVGEYLLWRRGATHASSATCDHLRKRGQFLTSAHLGGWKNSLQNWTFPPGED